MSIPRTAHFVFGLRAQDEPFHPLQYVAIESCRRLVAPAQIKVHLHHLPWGIHWDRIRPHVTVEHVELPELPVHFPAYHYAHLADLIRLDVLLRDGGLYADIDTIFLRPVPERLWEFPAVIGAEAPVSYPDGAGPEFSVSNALLLAEPGSEFLARWRDRMLPAMAGGWSDHSCRLATRLAAELPDLVHVEPQATFHPFDHTPAGMRALLEEPMVEGSLDGSVSVHTCAHLWWAQDRRDFSGFCARDATLAWLAGSGTPLARSAAPFLPAMP